MFESGLIKVAINDHLTHEVLPFNTDSIRFLFPNIADKFTGSKSVILQLTNHEWSPETVNFRTIDGRVGLFFELDLNWYVYDSPKQDPKMNIKNCGDKCIKFVTLTTEMFLTMSIGIGTSTTSEEKSKALSLGWLNLDLGGLTVKDPLFDINQERLFTFMNELIDG